MANTPTVIQHPIQLNLLNSFDELRALTTRASPNQTIQLVYGITFGDVFGGDFYFDPTSTTPDDNANIIAPSNGLVGRWKRLPNNNGGGGGSTGLPGTLAIDPHTGGHNIIQTEGDVISGTAGNVRLQGDGYVSGDLTIGVPDLSHTATIGDFQVTDVFSLVGRSLDLLSNNPLLDYKNNILTLGSVGISLDLLSNGIIDCGINQFKNALDPIDLQDLITINYLNGYDFTSKVVLTGDVSGPAGSNTVDKLKNISLSIPSHTATQDGYVLTYVNGSSNLQLKPTAATSVITLSGDVAGASNANTIGNNVVSNAKLRTSGALSVIGRSANSTGNVADIAGTNNTVLRISGSVLGFGAIDLGTAQVTASADISANTHKIINLVDPGAAQDAATKNYVDSTISVIAIRDTFYYFGTGADGTLTASSGTTTLSKDTYYNNVTLTGTAAINTNGYRLYVKGTLDISAAGAGAIFCNGADASGATGGAGAASNMILGGSVGANSVLGSNGSTATNTICNGGAGAAGGKARITFTGGTINNPAYSIAFGTFERNLSKPTAVNGFIFFLGGGGGGSSGAGGTFAGGGGGGGGGVVWLSAFIINRSGSTAASCIQANGGIGGVCVTGTNDSGGGGGGGGGWIFLSYYSLTGSSGTNIIAASGGDGGSGAGTLSFGGDGGSGGRITIINVVSGSVSESTGSAGGNGSLSTGGAGNTFRVSL